MLFCWENQLFRLGHGFFLSQTVDITRPGTLAYGILYWDAGMLIQRLWLLLTPSKWWSGVWPISIFCSQKLLFKKNSMDPIIWKFNAFFWNVNVNSFKIFVCPLKPENGGFHLECEPSCVSVVLIETCFSSGENWQSNIRVIREILLIWHTCLVGCLNWVIVCDW